MSSRQKQKLRYRLILPQFAMRSPRTAAFLDRESCQERSPFSNTSNRSKHHRKQRPKRQQPELLSRTPCLQHSIEQWKDPEKHIKQDYTQVQSRSHRQLGLWRVVTQGVVGKIGKSALVRSGMRIFEAMRILLKARLVQGWGQEGMVQGSLRQTGLTPPLTDWLSHPWPHPAPNLVQG